MAKALLDFRWTLFEILDSFDILQRNEVKDTPYERSIIELAKAGYHLNTEEDLTSIFCRFPFQILFQLAETNWSELVAAAYKRMGIMKTNVTSNSFNPNDFADTADQSFLGFENAYLEKETDIGLINKRKEKIFFWQLLLHRP